MSLAFIACQDPFEAVTHFAGAADRPPFPVLVDADRAVAKRYGVYSFYSGRRFRVARPATFLIGPDGGVRLSHIGKDPQDRVPIETLLTLKF